MNNTQKSCCVLAISFGICFNVLGMKAFGRANLQPTQPPPPQPVVVVQSGEVISSDSPVINQHTNDVNATPAYPPIDMYNHNPHEQLHVTQPSTSTVQTQVIVPSESQPFGNIMFASGKIGNVTVTVDNSHKAWIVIPDQGHGSPKTYYTKRGLMKEPVPQALIRAMINSRLGEGNTEDLLTALYQELYNQTVTAITSHGEISKVETVFYQTLSKQFGIDDVLKHKTLTPEEKFVCIGKMLKQGTIEAKYGKRISIMERINRGELTVMDALFWYNSHQQ
jgi:hypothetical protein